MIVQSELGLSRIAFLSFYPMPYCFSSIAKIGLNGYSFLWRVEMVYLLGIYWGLACTVEDKQVENDSAVESESIIDSECCNVGANQTANTLSYTCESQNITTLDRYSIVENVVSNGFSCAQSEESGTATVSCAGTGSGLIQCFSFASMGKTSGSCGSCETSLEDDGCIGYLPESIASRCVGQESCDIVISSSSASVGSQAEDFLWLNQDGSASTETDCGVNGKFKILAFCGEPTDFDGECQ